MSQLFLWFIIFLLLFLLIYLCTKKIEEDNQKNLLMDQYFNQKQFNPPFYSINQSSFPNINYYIPNYYLNQQYYKINCQNQIFPNSSYQTPTKSRSSCNSNPISTTPKESFLSKTSMADKNKFLKETQFLDEKINRIKNINSENKNDYFKNKWMFRSYSNMNNYDIIYRNSQFSQNPYSYNINKSLSGPMNNTNVLKMEDFLKGD